MQISKSKLPFALAANITRRFFSTIGSPASIDYLMSAEYFLSEVKQNPRYVQYNFRKVSTQLKFLADHGKWSDFIKIADLVSLQEIPLFEYRKIIGEGIARGTNRLLPDVDIFKLQQVLAAIAKMNFQPRNANETTKYELQDSVLFISVIEQVLAKLAKQAKVQQITQIGKTLLAVHPNLFLQYRDQLQRYLLSKYQKPCFHLNKVVIGGVQRNFWSRKTIQELYRLALKHKNRQIKQYIEFQDADSYPTTISETPIKKQVLDHKTEEKIASFLLNLRYCVDKNVLINNFEVDILIDRRIIVQFNGFQHYVTNSRRQDTQTMVSQWKMDTLAKRGFLVCPIHAEKWYQMKFFDEQKIFLINLIESSVLSDHRAKK